MSAIDALETQFTLRDRARVAWEEQQATQEHGVRSAAWELAFNVLDLGPDQITLGTITADGTSRSITFVADTLTFRATVKTSGATELHMRGRANQWEAIANLVDVGKALARLESP